MYEKLTKRRLLHDICGKNYKNARILHDNCPKNIFPIGGEGVRGGARASPTAVFYAYGNITTCVILHIAHCSLLVGPIIRLLFILPF